MSTPVKGCPQRADTPEQLAASKSVDVPAVLRAYRELRIKTQGLSMCTHDGSLPPIDDAISAVAELIEADKAYDAALGALEEHYRQVAQMGYLAARLNEARELSVRFVVAKTRRVRALGRVHGAA